MPFTTPWANFTVGDLVYGAHKVPGSWSRSTYLDSIFQGGLTIEDFHIIKSDKATSQVVKSEDRDAYELALTTHPKFRSSVNADGNNEDVRRKDKGGLMWAAKSGKTVHFVLDGLDIPAVVNKSFKGTAKGANTDRPATNSTTKNRSITGSELRWIFRNRHIPEVQNCVQFWFYKTQVCPPWVTYYELTVDTNSADFDMTMLPKDGAALWTAYTPSHEGASVAEWG
jgi:hypothetical protein